MAGESMTDGETRPSGSLPLGGHRVLDLSGGLGAYCARLLGDLGADVLKVEPPEGDAMRRQPPFKDGCTGPGASLVFAGYHANKRGVTLDVRRDEALPLLAELGGHADVVVITPSRRSPVAGFDRDGPSLSWARTDAVVGALTPFGLTGPMRDFRATPFVSFAMGGSMHHLGRPDGPPLNAPGQQQWDQAGLAATAGILAALRARPAVGGQLLDLSVHEVTAGKDYLIERYDVEGRGDWGRSVGIGYPPTGTWMCADGPLDVSSHQVRHWEAFLEMLGHPDELSEPALADPLVRRQAFDGLREVIDGIMAPLSRADLFERGQAAGLPCCPLNTPAQFVEDKQARARELFVTTTTDALGTVELPWRSFSSIPPLIEHRRAAPSLGQHNTEVFVDWLGHSPEELEEWKATGLV